MERRRDKRITYKKFSEMSAEKNFVINIVYPNQFIYLEHHIKVRIASEESHERRAITCILRFTLPILYINIIYIYI